MGGTTVLGYSKCGKIHEIITKSGEVTDISEIPWIRGNRKNYECCIKIIFIIGVCISYTKYPV